MSNNLPEPRWSDLMSGNSQTLPVVERPRLGQSDEDCRTKASYVLVVLQNKDYFNINNNYSSCHYGDCERDQDCTEKCELLREVEHWFYTYPWEVREAILAL